MSANRLWLWGGVLAAIGAVLWYRYQVLPGPESRATQTTRIVFVTGGLGPYWQLAAKGAEAASREHNAQLKVEMPSRDEDLEKQMKILVDLGAREIDGCAVSPLDANGQTLLINHLVKKMNVITFDSDAPLSERQYYIGMSNFRAGQICHELVCEALPEGGKIAVLLSSLTKNNISERKTGYEESEGKSSKNTIEGEASSTWQTVEYMIDEGDDERTKENILAALEKHEDLACIVGMNARHGPLLLKHLTEAGKLGKIKLVVFDVLGETLDGVNAGHIYATIAQDPYKYGYEAVRMLSALHNGDSQELPIVGGGAIYIKCQAIRQEDVEEFRKRLEERLKKAA